MYSRQRLALLIFYLFFSLPFVLAENAADPELKIGSILILSGEGSSWGVASRNGIELAIEDLNAQGGVLGKKLKAIHQDDKGDPKLAISAFRQLTDIEGAQFIIGPNWSPSGIALINLAKEKKTILISPSLGVKEFNESNEFLFNTWPHDFLLSAKLADYVYSQGHRNVALVGSQQLWVEEQTSTFKNRFETLGGKIVFLIEPLPGTTDLRTEAVKIKNLPQVDAFVSTTDGNIIGSLVAKFLKSLNVHLPLYSITLDQAAIDASQGGFEGLEFLTSLTPTPEFKKRYEEKFKTQIDIGADSAYDAVMMLTQAMKEANSTNDTEKIAAALANIKTYTGASGNLASDGKRGFTKEFAIKKIEGGKPKDL